ncbi:hypothetical protein, partial [Burkholderia gladioli]|uniref:hypothetical protein n=2 Tax=Burkholderia gladioli TaxID=28095 RepID=UPI001ABB9DA6
VSSAALRFQQQRSEIMINISQRVNYFFQRRDQHTASITSQSNEPAADSIWRSAHPTLLPLPHRVSVSAKEA